jgi:hypothetical protein
MLFDFFKYSGLNFIEKENRFDSSWAFNFPFYRLKAQNIETDQKAWYNSSIYF